MVAKLTKIKILSIIMTAPLISVFLYPTLSSASGPVINQGATTSYAILAGASITNTGATTVTGSTGTDIGVISGTITGAPGGNQHMNDASAIAAQNSLTTAYNNASGATPSTAIPADLNGQILVAGAYSTASGAFLLTGGGSVTFDAQNNPNSVFVIQAASTFTSSTNSTMILKNGAQACNIFWAIGSSATLAGGSNFLGHLYAQTSITLVTGATVQGNLLARSGSVTLDTNTIVNNDCAPVAVPVSPPVVPAPPVVLAGTIHVIKVVNNTYGGSATPANFTLSLKYHGVDVLGSPDVGMSSPGRSYTLAPGAYLLSEVPNPLFPNYISSVSIAGQTTNLINLKSGDNLVITETNTQLPPMAVVVPPIIVKTVHGGKLPKTGSPWYNMLLFSVGLVLLGGAMALFPTTARKTE